MGAWGAETSLEKEAKLACAVASVMASILAVSGSEAGRVGGETQEGGPMDSEYPEETCDVDMEGGRDPDLGRGGEGLSDRRDKASGTTCFFPGM